jgi:hypothetical protein
MYTLQGKTRPTHHTLFMLSLCMVHDHTYLTRSTYSNLSYSRQQIWTDPLHPRRRLPTQSTARRLSDPRVRTQLLSHNSQRTVGKSQAPVDNRLLGLSCPYHRHAIGTFNTCSRGPTERSLIDTGGGYKLGGAGLSHIHSPTFPTSCPHFHLMVPPDIHFNQNLANRPKCWVFK